MDLNKDLGVPISQSIVANVQLGLPSTVSKLSNKMRFIDKIAPILKEGGVIRNLDIIKPITIHSSGISACNRTTNAFGGILYVAGAVRQDILIKEGSIYQTKQESIVEVDEIDDLDYQKKLKFIDIINTYKLLDETMEDRNRPELVIIDVPLLLERSDEPVSDRPDILEHYNDCKNIIESFWLKHKDSIYPFDENGIKIVSVGTKRFGAVVFALSEDKQKYKPDYIKPNLSLVLEEYMDKIKTIGIRRLLSGILVKRSRTAAFQYEGVNPENRLEPASLREFGLMGMHIKAGNNTPPLLIEVVGKTEDWDSEKLDNLCATVMTLITFDQAKALPIPLWYAKYALKPIQSKPGVLEFYKAHAKEMLKNEDLESMWKEDMEIYEEG